MCGRFCFFVTEMGIAYIIYFVKCTIVHEYTLMYNTLKWCTLMYNTLKYYVVRSFPTTKKLSFFLSFFYLLECRALVVCVTKYELKKEEH